MSSLFILLFSTVALVVKLACESYGLAPLRAYLETNKMAVSLFVPPLHGHATWLQRFPLPNVALRCLRATWPTAKWSFSSTKTSLPSFSRRGPSSRSSSPCESGQHVVVISKHQSLLAPSFFFLSFATKDEIQAWNRSQCSLVTSVEDLSFDRGWWPDSSEVSDASGLSKGEQQQQHDADCPHFNLS